MRVWSKRAATTLMCALGAVVAIAVAAVNAASDPHRHGRRTVGYGQVRYAGAGPELWALRYRRERRLVSTLRRQIVRQRYTIAHRADVVEAINLAATVYGDGSTLWRKARCESRLNRYARNPSSAATGLFQFMPSTWRSTPFGGFSLFSPYAQALAAGWMHANGRGGEWACR